MVLIFVFSLYTYIQIFVLTSEQRAETLQNMREQSNPEYYILQELKKENK